MVQQNLREKRRQVGGVAVGHYHQWLETGKGEKEDAGNSGSRKICLEPVSSCWDHLRNEQAHRSIHWWQVMADGRQRGLRVLFQGISSYS